MKDTESTEKKIPNIKDLISPETLQKAMDWCWNAALHGIPGEKTCKQLADEYLSKQHSGNELNDRRKAASKFTKWQIAKCTTTGFLSGLPGGAAIIATIPADLTMSLYIQLRMIATVAVIGGYDVSEDIVKSMAYCCLGGLSITKTLKEVGIRVGEKMALAGLKKVPGKVLIAINKKVGFRLVTKFGTKGVVNLGKLVPVLGGVIGGGFNLAETTAIAKLAQIQFIENIFSDEDRNIIAEEATADEIIAEGEST